MSSSVAPHTEDKSLAGSTMIEPGQFDDCVVDVRNDNHTTGKFGGNDDPHSEVSQPTKETTHFTFCSQRSLPFRP